MNRALALFTYKLRFFFGPSLRGRFGPFAALALIAIFLPAAYFSGLGLGMAVRSLDADEALAVLSAPLAAVLCVGLLYSLGAGVTAHPSEFDFFLTADVRPREYLLADLAFQFVSLLAAVGMAAGLAAVAMVHAVGRPIAAALPMFGILAAYSALVLLTSQVLVVLRVRYPKIPVRLLTMLLSGLSPLPSRPDLAGRERRVRNLLRAHRGPARGPRGHADGRSRSAHGHADPHVPPRNPGDQLGLLRAREPLDPRDGGEVARRLLPRADAQLRRNRPGDDRGLPRPPSRRATLGPRCRGLGAPDRIPDRRGVRRDGDLDADQAQAVRPVLRGPGDLLPRLPRRVPRRGPDSGGRRAGAGPRG